MKPGSILLPLAAALLVATPAAADTLDEAIAAALARAPEIDAAVAGIDVAKGRLLAARAGYLPSVTASATIGRGRLDPQGFFGLGAADVRPGGVVGTVEQPLFAGGRTMAALAGARAGVEAAAATDETVRHGIILATVEAYGGVLSATEAVRQFRRLLAATEEAERQANERYEAGEAPATDMAQAAARRAEAEAVLARAEGAALAVRARYRQLTGAEPEALQPLPGNPPLPASAAQAIAQAIAHSPDLRRAEAEARASASAARAARADWLPELSAFAEGTMLRDQFFPGYRGNGTTVGLRGRWTLFSAATLGKGQQADAAARAADAGRRAVREQVGQQALTAFEEARTAALVERAAAAQADAAWQACANVQNEVEAGMKPGLALLDAAREAAAAGAAAAAAGTARILAAYRLHLLTGGQRG